MKRLRIMALIAFSLFIGADSCIYSYASAAPNLPPTLELVKPRLKLMRGNAYQYALERSGYDIQPGVNALQVLGAMETASQLADYAFADEEDYQATIQHVQDKSGLPDNLQGFNGELYFAKIDYLDMQLGVYMDAAGQKVGDALVQYKPEIQNALTGCIGTIANNIIGRVDLAAYQLDESLITSQGITGGGIGMTAFGMYKNDYARPTYRYDFNYVRIAECSPNSKFFILDYKGHPSRIVCITDGLTKPKIILDRWSSNNLSDFDKHIPLIGDNLYGGNVVRNGYRVYNGFIETYSHGIEHLAESRVSYPFVRINMDIYQFEDWFSKQFNADAMVNAGQAVALNPNAQNEPVAGQSFDLDSLQEHNRAVAEAVPEIAPSLEPLPENAPLYDPVSGLEAIPQPRPAVFPEYAPLPNPDPLPDPDPAPNPDPKPDTPFLPIPVEGLTDKFPFCIPFDLIDAFKLLVAEPETPVWELDFGIPNTSYTFVIKIDLSMFNDLAKLSRLLLMLAFIIALVVGTRNLISH